LFAETKDRHGMRRFQPRKLERVNIEALLIASGQNAKRLLAFGGRKPKKLAQAAALRPPTATGFEIGRVLRAAIGHQRASEWCQNSTVMAHKLFFPHTIGLSKPIQESRRADSNR
jgi:hypothetical protein